MISSMNPRKSIRRDWWMRYFRECDFFWKCDSGMKNTGKTMPDKNI